MFIFFKVFQKLAGLWLVGEVINHVRLYGSKAAEGCTAFQRRFCFDFTAIWFVFICTMYAAVIYNILFCYDVNSQIFCRFVSCERFYQD